MKPMLIEKTVYLAAPKRLLSSDLYDRAFLFMLEQSKGVMNPRWMFSSNEDWLANYEKRLEVCNAMVIVTDDNFVGRGVYQEYDYFKSRFCECYYYIEDEFMNDDGVMERTQEIVPVVKLQIEDSEDWKNYATVKY